MSQDNSLLIESIETKIPGSKVRVHMASGMWIIELVSTSLTEESRIKYYDDISSCVNTVTPGENIWKIFLYKKSEERFLIEATLHTTPRKSSTHGFVTITLAARDCFLLITEFDLEVLQMDRPKPYNILGVEYKNPSGQIIMPLQTSDIGSYQNIEFMGMMFNLDGSKIKKDAAGLVDIEI
nr:hypothetical protein BdHM001_10020 [Bdellovibrio sp. HM001]